MMQAACDSALDLSQSTVRLMVLHTANSRWRNVLLQMMAGTLPGRAPTMKTRIAVLTAACALALAACGDKPPADTGTSTPAATSAEVTAPTAVANDETATTASEAPALVSDKPAAVVTDCSTEIEGSDTMQYDVGSIVVPTSCTDFKITLKHVGQLPLAAMGHNVVIARAGDVQAIDTDGIAAGAAVGYIKPGDERVIAHTELIGGGQTTSVSFQVSKLQGDGPYAFFCSFPGHSALMKGAISVG